MTDELVPMQYAASGVQARTPLAPAPWSGVEPEAEAQGPGPAVLLTRLWDAVRRYKWLVIAIIALGVAAAVLAVRFVKPKYEVRATIWIASETPLAERSGPIRTGELLNSAAWVELLRSYRIVDAVVTKLALFVEPKRSADRPLFEGLRLANRFAPGEYMLDVDKAGTYQLYLSGTLLESGRVGDSIGRKVGLLWHPSAQQLRADGKGRTIEFTLATPRETSLEYINRLGNRLPEKSNFLWLTLEDEDAARAARILNTWASEYVKVAGDLKRKNIVEFADILDGQVAFAQKQLQDAERALEGFRTNTITLPTENAPVVAGLEQTRDPALSAYFERKIAQDNMRHDRESLEGLLARAGGETGVLEGAMLIPSVAQGQMGALLTADFKELYEKRAALAAARQVYTDEFKTVRELSETVQRLERETIPNRLRQILAQMRDQESRTSARIEAQTVDLRNIPTRTIEEMRLRRRVAVSEALYTTLQSRHSEARLAEASTNPDVSILDSAVAPLRSTGDAKATLAGGVVLASIGLAIVLAFLLDKLDGRVRYPEHVTRDLGLAILGTIPTLPRGSTASVEQAAQVVESFRSLRLGVTHAAGGGGGGPFSVAITSSGPGEGKSLIAANLALSFADAGFRTVLVDADTRRGALHVPFGLTMQDGLTDLLAGDLPLHVVLRETGHVGLRMITRGARRKRGPELLTSPAMVHLVHSLLRDADVVLFDTPPLAAGIDAFAIGTAAANMLTVLRVGKTNRRLTAAKLELLERLPVRTVGAVLNDAVLKGEFQHYSYLEGYYTDADDPVPSAGEARQTGGALVTQG